MQDRNTLTALTLSFLAGGLAGAGAALLFAPQSGKVTRDAVRGKFLETTSSARDLKDRVVRRGEELRDEASRRVGAAASALTGNGSAGGASSV